jgi:hypothetical protein
VRLWLTQTSVWVRAANSGGLFFLAQIAGVILLVCQMSPLAGHVYQGIAGRAGWDHVRESQTVASKLAILVCPTFHVRAPGELGKTQVMTSGFIWFHFFASNRLSARLASSS